MVGNLLTSTAKRYDPILYCFYVRKIIHLEVSIVIGHGLAFVTGEALDFTVGNVVAPEDGIEEMPPGVKGDIPFLLLFLADPDSPKGESQVKKSVDNRMSWFHLSDTSGCTAYQPELNHPECIPSGQQIPTSKSIFTDSHRTDRGFLQRSHRIIC
jgi:hypothetical protein